MIEQFFIFSSRGDAIIARSYRDTDGDATASSGTVKAVEVANQARQMASETFFRHLRTGKAAQGEMAAPIFNDKGQHFLYLHVKSLYFVLTSRSASKFSAALHFEFLNAVLKMVKDYCGVVSEDAIRLNTVLLYELLDEVVDYGYIQGTSSELLKAYVKNTPIEPGKKGLMKRLEGLKMKESKTVSSKASQRSIASEKTSKKNEIFCDLIEYLNVVVGPQGRVVSAEVLGQIVMKSFLQGTPQLQLQLNDNLRVVGVHVDDDQEKPHLMGGVVLDDASFHHLVSLSVFDSQRLLTLSPPQGELTLMQYRVAQHSNDHTGFSLPFRVIPTLEEYSESRADLTISVKADIPPQAYASMFTIIFRVPSYTQSVSFDSLGGAGGQQQEEPVQQSYDWKASEQTVYWVVKKFPGQKELTLRCKMNFDTRSPSGLLTGNGVRRDCSSLRVQFELPMHNVSGVQVQSLKLFERADNYNPARWVRYITQAKSYVVRLV